MPSTGLLSLRLPVEPQKGAPKEKTPPSPATIQYPDPSGVTVELTTGALRCLPVMSPRFWASPLVITRPALVKIQYPWPDGVADRLTAVSPAASAAFPREAAWPKGKTSP